MSDRIMQPAPIKPAVMPTIFAAELFDLMGNKVWHNPALCEDEVDELVILENEKWLDFLATIASQAAEIARLRAHVQKSADGHLAVAKFQRNALAVMRDAASQDDIDHINQAISANEKNAALHLAALQEATHG